MRVAKEEIRVRDISESHIKLVKKYLTKEFGQNIDIEIKEIKARARVINNREVTHTTHLLIIRMLN